MAARPRTVISRLVFSRGTYKNFFAAAAVKEWRNSDNSKVWCGNVVCGGRWLSVVGVFMCCGRVYVLWWSLVHVWFPASIPPSLLSRPRECPFGGPHSRGLESRWRSPLCLALVSVCLIFIYLVKKKEVRDK